MDYGAKASREGVDVKEASLDDLIFTSKYPSWKVKVEGTGSVTVTSGNTVGYTEVSHGVGYKPFVIGFAQPTNGSGRRLLLTGRTPGAGSDVRKFIHVDTSNFTVIYQEISAPGSDQTYNFSYYVMVDQNN